METRLSIIWLGLFGIIQSTDVFTTELDHARGAIESMPVSNGLLTQGIGVYLATKVALVIAAAVATLLSLRWLRGKQGRARALHGYVLSAIRVGTVAIAIASLNNAVLLRSLG